MKNLFYLFVVLICTSIMSAQSITITGTVFDDSGLPLPGANIIEKGTSNGTQANFDGKYSLTVPVGAHIEALYVGFNAQTLKIVPQVFTYNFNLSHSAQLDEVVVTARGILREKKSLGYATTNTLQGRTAGIQITNGVPGPSHQIAIRGVAHHTANDALNESYSRIEENIFKATQHAPLSTFSIDVDKAGYSNIRRFINNGIAVPEDVIKIEEMVNYFNYNYPEPLNNDPFSITTTVANSPWNKDTQVVRIALKGKDITKGTNNVPASNLVFLLDVSGSMHSPNKLPLLKSALEVLVNQLRDKDKVSIVVYAGAAGLVLPPTAGTEKEKIMAAINNLSAGGSTAGGAGIELAYKIATEQFIANGNNRVILATDGDFNVGAASDRSMENLIAEKRKTGVFLTCLGFGMGNYKDSKMETLADKGNGNYAYIDTMQEAKKVLGTEFFGTLYTIAKDVKIQVEFYPAAVSAYRLIGYENRLLNDEDFEDDAKDAGDLGSGHTVTALYEIVPAGVKSAYLKSIPNLKYTKQGYNNNAELLTVKFRYKDPQGNKSKLIEKILKNNDHTVTEMEPDFKFSAAVALFGMQLKKSHFISDFNKETVIALAEAGKGNDEDGYKAEFIRLVKSSKTL